MIRDAGISVLARPATDLYLMGRGDTRNVRRGLAPVRRLTEAGVNVAVSTNNVQNPFTPWGDADLLRMANLLATVAHLGTVEDLKLALRMATDNAARAIRLRDYGLVEGARADLVLLDCREPAEAVAAIPERLYVIKDAPCRSRTAWRRSSPAAGNTPCGHVCPGLSCRHHGSPTGPASPEAFRRARSRGDGPS
jgi:cytosine deaminase